MPPNRGNIRNNIILHYALYNVGNRIFIYCSASQALHIHAIYSLKQMSTCR